MKATQAFQKAYHFLPIHNYNLSRQQAKSFLVILKESSSRFAVNNVEISNKNRRTIHTNFVLLKERMFDNEIDQQIYEREKEALMKGSGSEGETNTQEETGSGMTNFVVVSSLFICIWYGLTYWYDKVTTSIREMESFDWLMSGNLNTNTLSDTDETNISLTLYAIKGYFKEHQYMDEFYNPNFIKNIFKLALSKNNNLSEQALEIISLIFRKGSSPRLVELFYKTSIQNKDFNVIRMVIDNISSFQNTSSHISFEELSNLANMSSRDVQSIQQFESIDMRQTRAMVLREKRSLSLISHFFSNKHLLKHFLEDETYKNELINLFNKGNDLERFIALICMNGIVMSCVTKSNMRSLNETHPHLINAMNQSAMKVKDQIYKNHVAILSRHIETMNENTMVLSLKSPNSTNLLGSAIVSFICHLHMKYQVRIPVHRSIWRASVLFAYCIYHSTYQKSLSNFLSDRVHNKNASLPLAEYNKKWNDSEYKILFLNGMLWIITNSIVRNWFAFVPLLLF
ncbi:hypothetical protein C9374_001266 [Naegleria lovaniensis]|uniref:Uncharacterized protein n=1 Tax=Naegleria lovaniensis TaxID=51637 RepID=A0AA88KS21_NAELO|nr:uncharacterized protein C9374_001266 [Naegleria lovaniensis]KAG2387672.1 hypothetical protein C9374_001266 [Naegleria lovaniensis]